MDQQITAYLDQLVTETLSQPSFAYLDPQKRSEFEGKLRDRLHDAILDLVVDNLSDAQVAELQDIDPASDQMEHKIEEYSATIPDLAQKMESVLKQEIETVKSNPQLLQA